MTKWKIQVDLDAAREEAQHLEEIIIEADSEDEAYEKIDKMCKEVLCYGGPYYRVDEIDDEEDEPEMEDDPEGLVDIIPEDV